MLNLHCKANCSLKMERDFFEFSKTNLLKYIIGLRGGVLLSIENLLAISVAIFGLFDGQHRQEKKTSDES